MLGEPVGQLDRHGRRSCLSRSSAEAEHTKARNRPETLGIADFVRLCGVCLRALTGWESCAGVTRGGRQRREEGCAPVETACLRETDHPSTPPGRDRTRRVPTGFRGSPDQISRKHWGFGRKIVRVCPSSAELRALTQAGRIGRGTARLRLELRCSGEAASSTGWARRTGRCCAGERVRVRYLSRTDTQAPTMGVQSYSSWPCGQNFHPEPGCHRRRDLRHEARSLGY